MLRMNWRERIRAMRRLARTYIPTKEQRGSRRLLRGGLAAPKVLRSQRRMYVAYRPDADVEFNCYPEVRDLAERWTANNFANNAGDLPRLYALVLNVKQVLTEGVAGDLAELGVYRGNSAAVLSHFARAHGRTVYLFDTYAGFPKRDLRDTDAGIRSAFDGTSLALVKETVGDGGAAYVPGYFPQTITETIASRRFSVVHLDCDLLGPMKAGLEFFYERMSPGGAIIIHDYANPHWADVKRAVDDYLSMKPEKLVLIPDKSGTAVMRKSSIG